MKKLFTFLLAIVASIGTMFAASGKCGENLTWELTDDVLTISGTGAMNNYSLGSTGSSTAPWNSYSSSIKSIIIKWGVTSIGEYAFNNCSRLQSVEIPNSVVSIGSHAFSGCVRMDSVNFGNGVTSIGNYAFYKCSGLTSVTIPNSVTSIGNWAFSYCSGLTSVTIGNSVTGIGRNAFGGCNSLTAVHILDLAAWCKIQFGEDVANPLSYAHNLYVNGELVTDLIIPNSVTSIKYKAFSGCTGLTSVTIPNSVTSIGNYAFASCTGLTSVTIPNSVTSIGDWAFYNCSSLTSVTIPNSVTSIGIKVFESCSGLTSVTIPNSVANIGSGAFYGCKISTIDYIGDIEEWLNKSWSPSDLSSGYSLLLNGSILEKVTIPDNVKSIKDNTFLNCISLTSVMLPDGVTKIGSSAFSGCTSLIYVTIPNSVINIGSDAFKNVPNIVYYGTATGSQWGAKSINGFTVGYFVYSDDTKATLTACSASAQGEITIPNSVTSIGKSAFYGCTNLTSVTIPNSVTSIGSSAFQECTSLTSVTIPNSVTSIGNYAFANCSSLTSVTIPNSVTSIGNYAFSRCTGLTSVTIPNSVTSIGEGAFYYCSVLASVTIPNSVKSIGNYTFANCSSLTFITIPNNVTGIGGYAFTGSKINTINYVGELKDWCEKLWSPDNISSNYQLLFNGELQKNVIIPNSVTSIGNYAFNNCSSLTSIEIPNSVASIGNSAFYNCSGLTKVIINDVAAWCKIDFANLLSNPLYYAHLLYLNDVEINSLIIPDNVTSIGDYTFYNCSNLTSVTIPNSVTSIGNSAFYGCTGLTSVTIPNSVTSIGNDAFYNVQNIMYQGTATGLPWGAKNINLFMDGYLLFSDETRTTLLACSREADGIIEIPNSVTSIGYYAFSGCTGLTSVTIPNSVTSIGYYAFYNCSKLNSITIEATTPPYLGDEAFDSTNDCPIIVPCDAVAVYKEKWSGYADRIVGNNCKSSYTITFANWDGKVLQSSQVEEGTLPKYTGTTPVRPEDEQYTYTFSGWSPAIVAATADATYTARYEATKKGNTSYTITFLDWDGTVLQSSQVEEGTLPKYTGATPVRPDDEQYTYTFNGWSPAIVAATADATYTARYEATKKETNTCGDNLTWDLTDGVLTISGTGKMTDFSYPDYGPWYSSRSSIKTLNISDGVTSIGNYAFYNCSALTSVTIPNSVTSIGNSAFEDCTGLTSVTIPNSVTSIGSSTFSGCSGLTSVTIGNSVTSIGKSAFADCSSLTSVTIGNSVTSIGDYAFEGCSGLTSMTIPNSVTSIGDWAFDGCSGLTSITIPKSVTSIGDVPFLLCSNLKTIDIDADNPNYSSERGVLFNKDKTTLIQCPGGKQGTYTIPNSVTSIGDFAFAQCYALTSIEIPNSVTSIGEYAFYLCSGLTSVIVGNGVKEIVSPTFAGCPLKNITLGTGLRKMSVGAFPYNVMMDGYDEYGLPMPKTDASGNFIYTVEKVVCYAKVPPTIELSGASDYKGFLDNFAEAVIYVPQESVSRYQAYTETWGRLDIRPIKAATADATSLTVTPSASSAEITWPQVSGAASYELIIKDKSGNVVCTLIFNAEGQLTSIAFAAPSRDGAPQRTQTAGFSFTITGLDSGSSYDLTMTSKDQNGNTIDEKQLSFSTNGSSPEAIDTIDAAKLGSSSKILRNGQVLIRRGDKLYTMQGQEVE